MSATLQVTVQALSAYSLSLNPSSVSFPAGGTADVVVNVARTEGFAGAVALTAENLPTGVTGAFTPAAPTASTSTLRLTAAPGMQPGAFSASVRGSAAGLPDRGVPLALQITAPPSRNVAWQFCTESPL